MFDDTYAIHYGEALDIFLLLGTEKALLIDTAYGRGELPNLINQLKGDRELVVVNSHEHFDHTGGNMWFPKVHDNIILPVKVLSKLFRGKYLHELKNLWDENRLEFHGNSEKYRNHYAFKELLNICYEKDWIPHCKKTFNGAQSVINYLGKYTHRIAISNHRIIRIDEDTVTYYVKDYHQEGKWKEHTISGIEFIRRFLMHVPPKCFVRIRHYGLLCTRTKTRHLTLCRNLLGCKQYFSRLKDMETSQILETLYGIKITVCRCCGGHLGKPQQRIPLRC